ncbi:hypothetical protein ACF3DV_20235 [Chlorogloeopsis fritschii PCC 9212]|jgi:hypothetical protein|uniref:Uncharacterized protein n=1 Tax=Chlorogloeopsis fritschii PCC 6912 TaxID=211165 RepID=A0A3S0XZP6_CHLFR|nr:hypothetical protein [Chlorogloeopsis fritschii]MBF2005369.1 hypothetical protein [Chlorogloeopsis fritschii C42_A2020_084]RUR84631.1 hypothetical protein PCC6912_15260 [Chlorogloeopsis fritschii PCC 6912]
MNKETVPNQAEKTNPQGDETQLSPEMLDKIKHPPKMDDVLRDLPPEELKNNQAVVPEMLDEPSDEIIGFTKD